MIPFQIHFLFLVGTLFLMAITYPFKRISLSEKIIQILFHTNGISSLFLIFYFAFQTNQNKIHFYDFDFSISTINLSIYFLDVFLITIISKFSFQYIHKEIGYHKFFLNLNLFWLGLFLFTFSQNDLILFAGWEFIGISSIFLISYYSYRKNPIKNSIYVLSFYKVADILLLTALMFLNSKGAGIAQGATQYFYMMIIIAGLIKSASFPFTSWLPRAMEGPTPSSAIYYAALSTNTGILLILKFIPELLKFESNQHLLLTAGILTFFYSSVQSRVQTDIKSSLGYSASTQMGIILVELSFGWSTLAFIHLALSNLLKTYQFIRTPSLLHIYHSIEGEYGKVLSKSGVHFEYLLPKKIRKTLYFLSLNHFYLDHGYQMISSLLLKIGKISRMRVFPLVSEEENLYRNFAWWIYYLIFSILIFADIILFQEYVFEYIPFFILVLSFGILVEKKTGAFLALFFSYKVLEELLIHHIHHHEYYEWIGVGVAGIFVFLLNSYIKARSKTQQYLLGGITIFTMLYFANFPLLPQSTVNDHIIEFFIEEQSLTNLITYCLASTIFTLGLYKFIFNQVYKTETLNG